MHRIAMAITACLLLAPAVSAAPLLELLVEMDTNCNGSVSLPPFGGFGIHGSIRARVDDFSDLRALNFAIEASQPILATYTPAAGVTASGNPFAEGASVSLPDCQTSNPSINLYDVTLLNFSGQPVFFTFHPLSGSGMTCPTVSSCDLVPSCVAATVGAVAAPATLQSPPDGATEVPTDADLYWQPYIHAFCTCVGDPIAYVFFGTDQNPPKVGVIDYEFSAPHFDPGPLQPSTTYYWRIEDWNCAAGNSSALGSFRTQDLVAVRSMNWTTVKKFYK